MINMYATWRKYAKVVISAMAVIGLLTSKPHAQELPIEHFTALDVINPLPASPVLAAYQDNLGYLWIANYGFGLLRYDGQSMEEYPALNEAIGRNIFALQQDPKGRLWVLSADEGLAVSEQPLSAYVAGATVQFTDTPGAVPLPKGGFDLFTAPLTKDLQGSLWLATPQTGIIRYSYNESADLVADTLGTVRKRDNSDATVKALITRTNGSVWVSLFNDALLVFEDGGGGQQEVLEREPPCADTLKLFEDSNATLWAGCTHGDVWRFVEDSFTWENVKPAERMQAYITGIAEVAPGVLWVTILGKGIWELDIATGETVEYTRRNGLLDRNVWDVTTDLEGNIWVSQNTGLSKLRMNQAAFRTYTSRSYTGERPALVGAEALASEPDIAWPLSSGDTLQVLVSATTGGLSLIGSNGMVEHLTVENGLTSNLLLDVCHDAVGRIWIMTRDGFDILTTGTPAPDMPNFATEQRLTLFGEEATLTSYRIGMAIGCGTLPETMAFDEDPAEEEAVVCFVKSQRPAVVCWAGNRWLFFDEGSGIPVKPFQALAWDEAGHLYAGSTQNGLYRSIVPLSYATPDTLTGLDDTIVPFVRQPVFERVLGAEGEPFAKLGVRKIVRVGKSIWVQPTDAPTLIIDGATSRVTGEVDFRGSNKLPNTLVYSPLTNTVWLSTSEGIMEADTAGTLTGRRVGQSDGLLYHTASGPPALGMGFDGMIYHSSTAGITRYQPSRDRQNTIPPPLVFRSITYSENNAGSNELEITYAALSFTSERQVRYRTRLLGFDDNWSQPTVETRTRYTNLSAFALPRTYTFEVQAANNDGIWTETPLSHQVRVQPAWWKKWWALTLYSGIFLALVIVTDRLQRKRLIEREREKTRERELEQARETQRAYARLEESHQELKRTQNQLIQQEKLASLGQLTAGIAHEIKNPLNFVNNFSDVSIEMIDEVFEELQRIDGNEHAAEAAAILADIKSNLSKVHEHGSRADSIVKSMLQHSRGGDGKMEPTDLNALVKEYVKLAYHGMRAGKEPITVDIDQQLDESVGELPLIAEDFSRVILNLCNNAFDAMRETAEMRPPKLTVRTSRKDGALAIEIEDNGTGIPDEIKDKILQPFFTTKKGTQGTGLGLSITHDIVKAHGGSIGIDSEPGKTIFKVILH